MVIRKLTARQEEILRFIINYIQDSERPPTIRDIADHFEFTVKGAYDHLLALERKGWIERDCKHSRGITIKEFPVGMERLKHHRELMKEDIRAIPLVGRIAAGAPESAIETSDEKFFIGGDYLSGYEHFALKVNGDSMEGAGIYNGDIVIVKRQETARNNEIVVAILEEIESEATLKRFIKDGSRIILRPENPLYEDIQIPDPRRLHINGVVVGLYRPIR
ncbi:MAG: transcriptional repressor LexA [bacterium]|nr:transcriptional repressor LexA [bacterium]